MMHTSLKDHACSVRATERHHDTTIHNDRLFVADSSLKIILDASRQHIDDSLLDSLFELAQTRGVNTLRDRVFANHKVNTTENRSVGHHWWRAAEQVSAPPEELNNCPGEIWHEQQRFWRFVRSFETNTEITDVVNIGIGGSDLGPALVARALSPWAPRRTTLHGHFVANVCPAALADTLAPLDPERTLIVVVSKTFGTSETLRNFHTARDWLQDDQSIVAVSANPSRAAALGVDPDQIFNMLEFTGGRTSIWSPAGLSAALILGEQVFRDFLRGGAALDHHFRTTPPERNLPTLLAVIELCNRNLLDYGTRAVIPYDERLNLLPAYLQQLEMESNGKASTEHHTAPVVWGSSGTNAQHAYFQALHQGTSVTPLDILVAANPSLANNHVPNLDGSLWQNHHQLLMANAVAQAEALWRGKENHDEPWRHFNGGRPSSVLIYPEMSPSILGTLIALYEHKTLALGAMWGINSFDQWGVELGKEIAGQLVHTPNASSDPLSQRLLDHLQRWRHGPSPHKSA